MGKDASRLKLIQVNDAILIPRYLIDQVKGLPFPAENFYKYYSFYAGPFSFLYAVSDMEDLESPIKGVVWYSIDPMAQAIRFNIVSIHKDYQFGPFMEKVVFPKIHEAAEALDIKICYWVTTRPKAFTKMGFRRSGLTLMEAI
jgi:hypothetical protein